nr:MAG TPA: hypothetical protein [Caudoviricetes sp.]
MYIRAFTNKSRHVICIVVRIILGRFVSTGAVCPYLLVAAGLLFLPLVKYFISYRLY